MFYLKGTTYTMIRFIFAAGLASLAIVFIAWWIYITYLGLVVFFTKRSDRKKTKKNKPLDSSAC